MHRVKAIRTLILYNNYLVELAAPILKKEGIKYSTLEINKTSSIDKTLAKLYPSLILIESNKDNNKNLELLRQCISICENSNIIFITESSDLDACVKLVKAGADEVISSSEIATKSNLFKVLTGALNYRKRLVRKSDIENISQTVAKIGSWEYNIEQNILFWSDITKRIHEVPEDFVPIVEEAVNFYNEGWSRDTISKAFGALLQSGEKIDLELPITTAKNNEVWVSAIGESQFVGDKCLRVFGTFQDITPRKMLEQQLRNSELKYQKVVEASNDVIWEIEVGTDIVNYVRVSSESKQTYKEISLRSILRNIHKEDRSRFVISLKNIIGNDTVAIWNCQYRIKSDDRNYIWIEDNASIIRDANGKAMRIIGAAKNITEKKNYLKKIESQNAVFRKITWTQSHVLRSPVVNILGLLDLLKLELKTATETEEIISLLEVAALDLDETIKETVKQSNEALLNLEKEESTKKNPVIQIIKDWY